MTTMNKLLSAALLSLAGSIGFAQTPAVAPADAAAPGATAVKPATDAGAKPAHAKKQHKQGTKHSSKARSSDAAATPAPQPQ